MMPKYFWRRVFAYLGDLFLIAVAFLILSIILQPLFETKIVPPGIINSSYCENSTRFTEEKLAKLFPSQIEGERFQVECYATRMLVSKFTIFQAGIVQTNNNKTTKAHFSYAIDEEGKRINIFELDPLFYLIFPLIMAILISKNSSSICKKQLGLEIRTSKNIKPNLAEALKREYLKHLPFVVFGIFALTQTSSFIMESDEELAKLAIEQLEKLNAASVFGTYFIVGLILALALSWFYCGPFIRWRGQTYWDKFAGLEVGQQADFNEKNV